MKNPSVVIAAAAIVIGLSACQSESPPESSTQSSPILGQSTGPRIAAELPLSAQVFFEGERPPFPQFTTFGSEIWWTDYEIVIEPELLAEITAHMAQPVQYELSTQRGDYALPFDSHFFREEDTLDLLTTIHTLDCPEDQTGAIFETINRDCPGLIGRIFERSGRMRGNAAFVQRNYLIELSDGELAALSDELTAMADSSVEIFEQMRRDSSAGIITREQRQAMQGAPGVLDASALRVEALIIDEYLALDEELRSLYRQVVRNWAENE